MYTLEKYLFFLILYDNNINHRVQTVTPKYSRPNVSFPFHTNFVFCCLIVLRLCPKQSVHLEIRLPNEKLIRTNK